MDAEKQVAAAVHRHYWQEDINCARTMLAILAALDGRPVPAAVMKAAVGMHGAGGFGAQCGLVEGALMYIGLAADNAGLSEETAVETCREYAAAFADRFGSLLCRELRPEGFGPDNPPHLCEGRTVAAVVFAIEFLTGRGLIVRRRPDGGHGG